MVQKFNAETPKSLEQANIFISSQKLIKNFILFFFLVLMFFFLCYGRAKEKITLFL